MATKPKLETDDNTENVKLAAEMLNDVSFWLIDEYKLLYFNGDVWVSKKGIYQVLELNHFKSWIKADFPLLTPRQIDVVILNCNNCLDYETNHLLKQFKNKVYFTNGIYDLEEGTFQRKLPDEIGFSPNMIPYPFKSFTQQQLKADKFVKLYKLLNIFGQFDKELLTYFLEIMGSALSMRTPFANFVVFFGDGNNSKSTLLKFLTGAFGDKNTNTFSLGRLADRNNALAEKMSFYGKTFVYDPDAANTKINDMSDIKQITGGDEITGREVYGKAKKFVNYSTVVIMTNHVPKIPETTKAIDRRLHLYPFTKDLDTLKPEQKLTLQELDEVFEDQEIFQAFSALALTHFHKAIKRGELSKPSKFDALLKNFKSNNNDVYRWLFEEGIMEDIRLEGEYNPATLFDKFESWNAKEKTGRNWSRKGFTQQLNTTIKKDFGLDIEPTQSRINGKVTRKYTIISKEIAQGMSEAK